jgi:class 3 adenylate cyclase
MREHRRRVEIRRARRGHTSDDRSAQRKLLQHARFDGHGGRHRVSRVVAAVRVGVAPVARAMLMAAPIAVTMLQKDMTEFAYAWSTHDLGHEVAFVGQVGMRTCLQAVFAG